MQIIDAYGKNRIMEIIGGSKLLVLLHLSCCFLNFGSGTAVNSITSSKSIKYPEAITSNNGVFRLGFFGLSNSSNRYVGIWYENKGNPQESVIWVANRDKPLNDDSGVLMISEDGNLVVSNGDKEILWSSNVRNPAVTNVSAEVLDSGNLVLQGNTTVNGVTRLWESFQHPSNVFMPTMKISTNIRTGERVQLTSWKSSSDPTNGNFSIGLEPLNVPQAFIWKNTRPYWRSGPWNGQTFIGVPNMTSYVREGIRIVNDNEGTLFLTYTFAESSRLSYIILDPEGHIVQRDWDDQEGDWISIFSQETECYIYGKCGAFGVCDARNRNPSICSCLRGFEPKNKDEWNKGSWNKGCVRTKPLQCEQTYNSSQFGKEDGFLKMERMKVPDFAEWSAHMEDECKRQCLDNCSCIAYAYDEGIGCMSWGKDLIDMEHFSSGGINLYIRLNPSQLDQKKNINTIVIIITVIIGVIIIIPTSVFLLLRWMAKSKGGNILECKEIKLHQLPLFKFEELATATSNFKISNKLGEGGFGSVYKGKLTDGREIAVKRLSRASGQGFDELANEVLVISKLQHRNLVRILGCCIEREEKMLVYEYMPNKSLDAYLFDPGKQKLLDWRKRFNIIEGISRGLLYLHRDSRLRIIHRDLKASNILLDEEMNPKISDFGMARIFGGNENEANTRRVVGTYGYMAPEYAMHGHFSEKSDVFSYGVLLLEIISGRKNTSFCKNDYPFSLLGYAWELWTEDNILELIDKAVISEQSYHQEIKRCTHVGLLCVQEFANDRPTMSVVLSMLNSEVVDLPLPKQPAFTEKWIALDIESLQSNQNRYSKNEVTITRIDGR